MFEDPRLLEKLHNKFVLVGLNGSGKHDEFLEFNKAWYNFHSDYSYGHDYKMRYAFEGTPIWGSYITDIIKYYQEVDSGKVAKYVKSNPSVHKENIDSFEEELTLLGGNPVLVALGGPTYTFLKENLVSDYKIVRIKHYSYTIGPEVYRKECLELLTPFF